MYPTTKEVNARIRKAREEGDLETITMLEHYHQLRFSWIPQVKKRFLEPDFGGLYTPHRSVLREDVVRKWAKKYKIRYSEKDMDDAYDKGWHDGQ